MVVGQGEADHGLQIPGVAGRHDHHVRQRAQIRQIEHAMVRGPIRTGQPGAIHQEQDGQVLQGDFLEDLVVGSLEEGAVDIDDRPHARAGQSGREGHGMGLADTDVKKPLGELVADRFELVALAHGRRDHRDAMVVVHAVEQRVPHDLGVELAHLLLERQRAVGLDERSRGVEGGGIFRGRLESMALFGHDVQHDGQIEVAGHPQVFLQLRDIVAVDRPDVAETEPLEEHAAEQARLDGILDLGKKPFGRIADHRHLVENALDVTLECGVERGHSEPVEIVAHRPDARTNRHFVVVEHDGQLFVEPAGVVHRLEDDARGKSPVADDGHDVVRFVGGEVIVAASQTQRGAHATSCVSGHEQIIGAFLRVGIAHQTTLGPDRAELPKAPREHFVRIDLMARVPDQPVAAEIEGGVQRQAQLDHAQIGREMSTSRRHQPAKRVAHLGRQLRELRLRQILQVGRRAYLGE